MTVGDLKKSLAKLDPDMDSSEVFMITTCDGMRAYSLLAATGYINIEGTAYAALVSDEEAKKQLLRA